MDKFTCDKDAKRWIVYLETLTWEQGHLDDSSYRAALRAASLGIEADYVFDALCALIENAGDVAKPEKIRSQINRAFTYVEESPTEERQAVVYEKPAGSPIPPRSKVKAEFDPAALHQVASQVAVSDIHEFVIRKSARTPDYVRSGDFLDALYHPGEKIRIFTKYKSAGQLLWERGATPPEEIPRDGPEGVWFLVNPVDGQSYPNPRQEGKLSGRSQEAVTAFRYAVLESDAAPAEDWLRLLVQLPLPIESIAESGGRSIHALLRVDAKSKADWDFIIKPAKPILTRLGADPGALSAVRLSRLPQAVRGDRQQRLLYLNPDASPTPILELPDRPAWGDWLEWAGLVQRANLEARPEDLQACLQNLDAALPNVRVALAMQLLRVRGGAA